MRNFRISILSLILASAAAVSGQTPLELFISPAGDDQTGTGSRNSPVATLDRAWALAGNDSGTINLLPGEYADRGFYLSHRPLAGSASIIIRPAEGRNTVKILYSGGQSFVGGISAANVTLKDLRFYTSAPVVLLVEMSASGFAARNCLFDQSGGPQEGSVAIRLGGNLAPVLERAVIAGNTFIGPSLAAVEVGNAVDMLHYIHNTVHLPGSAHGLLVKAAAYSGVVVDDNIFNYLVYAAGRNVLEFVGKGKGTRINLNCVSSPNGIAGAVLARKAATRTIMDLQLAFRSLDSSDQDPGASLRGACFDIFAQENMSVLRKP